MRLVKCSICHKEFTSESEFNSYACPKKDVNQCNSDVRVQFENLGFQSTYAIVGPVESGKSYYIYALLYKLIDDQDDTLRDFLNSINMSIELVGVDSLRQYEKFKTKLLSEQLMKTTEFDLENNTPLILLLKIGTGSKQKQIKLSFFDLSGENFRNDRSFMKDEPRIHRAKGILFLQDPFSDSKLSKLVLNQSLVPLNPENNNLLNDLYQAIIKNENRPRNKVSIPIAFCLSMFDLIEHWIPELAPASAYLEVDDLISSKKLFNLRLIEQKTKEFKEFLLKNSRIPVKSLEDRFTHHAVFAFSAIGHDNVSNIDTLGIEPKGIIAPLLWLLAVSGFIDSQK